VLVSRPGDSLTSILFTLDRLLEGASFAGDPVVMVPDSKLLIVADSTNDTALAAMVDLASNCLGVVGRGLSGVALQKTPNGWLHFKPRNDRLAMKLRRLEIPFELRAFERQKRLLEGLRLGSDSTQVIVGAELGSGAFPTTVSRWAAPGDLLLPVTDQLEVPPRRAGEAPRVLAWGEAMAKLGDYVEATDLYPPRVRLRGYAAYEALQSL